MERSFTADRVTLRLVEFSPKPPTEIGYHWLKEGDSPAVIVEVFEMQGCGGLRYSRGGEERAVESVKGALWFGPLSPPTT